MKKEEFLSFLEKMHSQECVISSNNLRDKCLINARINVKVVHKDFKKCSNISINNSKTLMKRNSKMFLNKLKKLLNKF